MWLMLSGLALAGLRADIGTATQGSPDAAVACSSARTAWSLIGRVLQPAATGPAADELGRVFEEGKADGLFEEGARLSVAWWRAGGEVQIGFDTHQTSEQVARAFAALDAKGGPEVLQGPEGWLVRTGEQMREVRVKDGWARIFQGSPPAEGPRVLPAKLVKALPEDPGCLAVIHMIDADVGELDVGLHLPFESGSPTTFALAGHAMDAFTGVLLRTPAPPDVRTPSAPEALALLGVGIDSLDFSTFLQGKQLRMARRAQNLFPVTAGTTVAFLATEPRPVFAARLPLPQRMGPRVVARRARRLLGTTDFHVVKGDPTHFTMEGGRLHWYFAAKRGALYVANEPGAIAAVEAGKGEPWVDERVGELADRYPFVLSSRVLPHGPGQPFERLDEPFTVALDLRPGLVTGVMFLPFTFDELIDRARGGGAGELTTSLEETLPER